jgi:diadenosine tetraphosphate (Ap4A) HIT family hydrolase
MEELQSIRGFHHYYRQQLERIAAQDTPSANQLVLVLANALMLKDRDLIDIVQAKAQALGHLNPVGTEDEHILSYVYESVNPLELIHRRTTPHGWQIQFNELRALRPRRESQTPMHSLRKPYDPKVFNFNMVPMEAFWKGEWKGRSVSLFFNKFPFEPYHTLIVPEPETGLEQYIRPEDHAFIWDLQAYLSKHQPNLVIGYNPHGAGESVNHLHFQLTPEAGHLRLFHPTTAGAPHPLKIDTFTDSQPAWRHLNELQSKNRPFDAVYAPGRIHIIERAFQGTTQMPSWTTGFAWYEISGGIITIDETAYRRLNDSQIEAVFEDMRPQ